MPGAGGRGRRTGNPFLLIVNFVRDVRSELRKVAWPSQRETVNLTVVVIALSVAMGLFLGGVDFIFQELFRFLLGLSGASA
jgi:preprotein translocase subunit SecE